MSRALLQQSVYRMVADGEPLVRGNTGVLASVLLRFRKPGEFGGLE